MINFCKSIVEHMNSSVFRFYNHAADVKNFVQEPRASKKNCPDQMLTYLTKDDIVVEKSFACIHMKQYQDIPV